MTNTEQLDEILKQFEYYIRRPNSTLYRHHDYLRTIQALLAWNKATVIEALDLLYWQYKENNHQSVQNTFVDAYNTVKECVLDVALNKQGERP